MMPQFPMVVVVAVVLLSNDSAAFVANSGKSVNWSRLMNDRGADANRSAGINYGRTFEDESDAYAEEQRQRQAVIDKVLERQDAEFKEERRRKLWGEFADAKSKEDIAKVDKSIRERNALQHEMHSTLAKKSGVEFELLEPQAPTGEEVVATAARDGPEKWYSNLDDELKQEWLELETRKHADSKGMGVPDTVQIDGKIVSRDDMQGVRIGSVGGWSVEIFPGDFVVHRKFGIGKFERVCLSPKKTLTVEEQVARDARRAEILNAELGEAPGETTSKKIEAIKSRFGTEDDHDPVSNPMCTVLEITYADGAVHVPVDRAYRISRYRSGSSVAKPKLSRIKGGAWLRAKRKVEQSTLQLAQDVLALYATREALKRPPFDPSKEVVMDAFDRTFKYEPTPDQLKCFEDVENDMVWRSSPMDRLVCGDVGFGKTEVAMRAIFRAVANGRQAALLAPTGVLAAQHYRTVEKRMGEDTQFSKRVALLRGGMGGNTKAGRAMREQLQNGTIDVVVGTHALLSKNLEFCDLGLLVVDEEQRFGVKQKERLKVICGGVDVLTLTATPIPRTLQMSISGIRDTSTIQSPPPMRKPTITSVHNFDMDVVRSAIQEEVDRGGQCYYVVPKISMLDDAEDRIRQSFPELRTVQAHGRMGRRLAEENVAAFAEGAFDILLATTVIENGVDIPSVNTIIVQDSQHFGMSTLYQLRGRVGRSDLQGYAYLMHSDTIGDQAALRLHAITQLGELGSGFDVAHRDLEIRGAGSLLGVEQSGTAARVGFDLYMRMLKKSIQQLRGLDIPFVPRTNVLLPKQQGSMEAKRTGESGVVPFSALRIPTLYIPDPDERNAQESAARLSKSSASLTELTNEWKDKYGPVPASLQKALKTLHLHACTRILGIDLVGLVEMGDGRIGCVMRSPGLRPRHWASIVPALPSGVAPIGLDVFFPSRFTASGRDENLVGGRSFDVSSLLEDPSMDDDSERWDSLDEGEVEAMKENSSAYNVKNLGEVDLERYPRFTIEDFGTGNKAVDRLLRTLLPVAKVVFEQQLEQKAAMKSAAELHQKRQTMRKKIAERKASSRSA